MTPPKNLLSRDIRTRTDVHDLVVAFYREIIFDDLLAPVFGEVAEVDWAMHIPKLIDYWCQVLLGEPGYVGAMLHAHREVHDMEAFQPQFFDRWYALFAATLDKSWSGPTVDKAKQHATRVAGVLARRLLDIEWPDRWDTTSLTSAT
ncbi:MAG: group III truncated hemoglobin [Acidimicrobiales bacterium]